MNPTLKPYFQAPFLICFGVLTTAAVGMNATIQLLNVQLKKYPIPLRKPLDQIDEKGLTPYVVRVKTPITNPDILNSLGTRDYIQWSLEDTSVAADSPVRFCNLMITYYTGDPDQVPHVPDKCYVGGGNIKKDGQILRLKFPAAGGSESSSLPAELAVNRLVFIPKDAPAWDPQSAFSVLYFFHVNGEYADGRGQTRAILSKNFTCKYSYFSKVEWKFAGLGGSPGEEEIAPASEKLMSVLLPILVEKHWPDWEKAKKE